jgi:hypothetical protein
MSDEDESIMDTIFNSLSKKDRKELFALKEGVLTMKKPEELKKAWKTWSSIALQAYYQRLSSNEKKVMDQLSFLEKVEKLEKAVNKDKMKRREKDPEESSSDEDGDEDTTPPEDLIDKDSSDDEEAEATKKTKQLSATENQLRFQKIVHRYMQEKPYIFDADKALELEVRFGTRGVKRLTKTNFDSVVQVLKSFGYICDDVNGSYCLKMQNEFVNKVSGRSEISNIRTEIRGLEMIHHFCKTNNLKELMSKHSNAVKFLRKLPLFSDSERLKPVNFDDFNFRVSLQKEELLTSTKGTAAYIIKQWKSTKKIFRYVNRVTFRLPDSPVKVELSLIRSSEMGKTFFTTNDSNVFLRPEHVEIELEIDNSRVGPGTPFDNDKDLLDSLRKAVKHVLFGLQQTKFPISYPEQAKVLTEYMELVYGDAEKPAQTNNFIGPSSNTLQRINIAPINENVVAPNVRKDYTVTDKADGLRHLLYVNEKGKIFLINSQMHIIFTGAQTTNKDCFQSILDGELILNDKYGKYINLFAVFDIYFFNKKNMRALPLILEGIHQPIKKDERNVEKEKEQCRLFQMNQFIKMLRPESVLSSSPLSPIRIECKQFYPMNPSNENIFVACDTILGKEKEGLFEYTIDGLIFTPAYYGVGGDGIGKVGPLSKATWDFSFKQKPAKYNTIDFMVTTVKNTSGEDDIFTIFDQGTQVQQPYPLSQYKKIELRVTFVEKIHGYLNPCQDIIDDRFNEVNDGSQNLNDAKPVIFYPTHPYDPEAGIANIMLRLDESNTMQMFTEEGDVFGDNMIVEFSYSFEKEKGWRWVPLRLRHDKTSELHQGGRNFGNAYHVANSNWQSIHNPVTDEMIRTGMNIPEIEVDEDIYYNYTAGNARTEGLRNFHNLYVKKNLIKSVSKGGDTLIDFACGKAGDLSKWISANLSFVFGIDISKDNLENRLDGACARYLNAKRTNKNVPYCLFVNGNCAFNIRNGAAMRDDKSIQITKAIFGEGSDKASVIGKGVARHFGVAAEGFHVSSCQFALHYFFKDPETIKGFMRNLSETTRLNGYFVGTAYDGKIIFKMLQQKQFGESVQIVLEDGKKVWEVIKRYNQEKLDDTSSSLGFQIDVYQESINQLLSEYLINFDYLNRVMENYGFQLVERNEAISLGLPEGTGLFSELYSQMLQEPERNKCNYGKAFEMTEYEKRVSFLNRYFVYKKIRNVNASKVVLDTDDFDEKTQGKNKETKQEHESKDADKPKDTDKPKIKKLKKKLMLVPSDESLATEKLVEKSKTAIKFKTKDKKNNAETENKKDKTI